MEHRKTVSMHHRQCLTALFLFFSGAIYAQQTDITGLWKGTIYNDTTQMEYQYEVGISKVKGKLLGFSHTWFILDDKQYYGVKKVKVTIANDGKIIIEDDGLIANNYPVPPNKNVRQLNILTLDATSSIMTLKGLYRTNRTKDFHVLTGSVSLQRENDIWQSALIPHLEELGKAADLSFLKADKEGKFRIDTIATASTTPNHINPSLQESTHEIDTLHKNEEAKAVAQQKAVATAKKEKAAKQEEQDQLKVAAAMEKASSGAQEAAEKFTKATELAMEKERKKEDTALAKLAELIAKPAAQVNERTTIVQQTVSFTSDSLLLSLYDNGEIDGDTVSVLLNGSIVLEKQGLSTTAIKKTIYIPANVDKMELIMYAESLGAIPPNTGLLVIRDGKKLYEVRFSGDLQKNAAIVLNRKKE